MKIAIGSDHRGYNVKQEIERYFEDNKIEYIDCGANSEETVDYPNIVRKVAKLVQDEECKRGILICGTGLGMAITANKYKNIRCANCYNSQMAEYSRRHNDANILALGAGQNSKEEIIEMIKIWLSTNFDGGRHENRIELINQIEKENMK